MSGKSAGQLAYEASCARRLELFDADPPMRARKDGSVEPVPRPRFTKWSRLSGELREGWERHADALS